MHIPPGASTTTESQLQQNDHQAEPHQRHVPPPKPPQMLAVKSLTGRQHHKRHPPMVRSPSGSTMRASCRASLFARSALAGETARMITLGGPMWSRTWGSRSRQVCCVCVCACVRVCVCVCVLAGGTTKMIKVGGLMWSRS